jgi:hypothetical protein
VRIRKSTFFGKIIHPLKTKEMKKIILLFVLAGSIFACSKKEDGAAASASTSTDPSAVLAGVVIDTSANVGLVMKAIRAIESGDSAAYRATYAPDVVFHDNLDSMGLNENMTMFKTMAEKGIKLKVEMGPVWENQFDKPSKKKGYTNYVMSKSTFIFTRGEKQTKMVIFAVDAIKDGKQVEEWLHYDRSAFVEISK